MTKRHAVALLAVAIMTMPLTLSAAERPSLVVNIIVGQMRYDCLERFGKNFSDDGIGAFIRRGLCFSQSRYDFMQTSTPATLATISTGADPSMHGIVSPVWLNYTTGNIEQLVHDERAASYDSDPDTYRVSNANIIVPTLGDKLLEESAGSKVVTVAADAMSAIVLAGMRSTDVYWVDSLRGKWTTSNAYRADLPDWVEKYNDKKVERDYVGKSWTISRAADVYVNTLSSVIVAGDDVSASGRGVSRNYPELMRRPAGNYMVADFAKHAVESERLGQRGHIDLLNICFDSSRHVLEIFGPESVEAEDMYYRLDEALDGLMTYIRAAVGEQNVLFVLTSDHGASDSYDLAAVPHDRFNAEQFRVVLGGYLGAIYGGDEDWVKAYADRQVYLNRTQISGMGLNLRDVQQHAAAFALEFRGVSHVLTSSDMQSGYFGASYAQKIQNSFYPKRSGDLTVNLMPGWIEENGMRSLSGSMYDYDTHVPLMFWWSGQQPASVDRPVNMNSLAATLARLMGINRPIASTAEPIVEVTEAFK